MFKKRWYDGLHDIYEGKYEFEIKFGCFGGDGGNGGGSKTPAPPSDPAPAPAPDTGYRGEDSAARSSAADTAAAAAAAGLGTGYGTGTTDTSSKGGNLDTSMENMSMDEALGLTATNLSTPVSLTTPTVAPTAKTLADMYADAQAKAESLSASTNQKSQAQQNLEASLNQGILGAQYSSPTTTGFQGFSPFNPASKGLGFGVEAKFGFAKGGAVQQGIGSIFPYPRR